MRLTNKLLFALLAPSVAFAWIIRGEVKAASGTDASIEVTAAKGKKEAMPTYHKPGGIMRSKVRPDPITLKFDDIPAEGKIAHIGEYEGFLFSRNFLALNSSEIQLPEPNQPVSAPNVAVATTDKRQADTALFPESFFTSIEGRLFNVRDFFINPLLREEDAKKIKSFAVCISAQIEGEDVGGWCEKVVYNGKMIKVDAMGVGPALKFGIAVIVGGQYEYNFSLDDLTVEWESRDDPDDDSPGFDDDL